MTLAQLHAYRMALRDKLRDLDDIRTTCHNCEHFASGKVCAKFDAVPPDEFQRTPDACQEWQHDGIPF
jgi:hypothetical protein